MIALVMGTAVAAGVGIGWYGHKAGQRIAAWGIKANEQDLIFQQMSEGEGETWAVSNRRIEDTPVGATLGSSHFPAAAAASK